MSFGFDEVADSAANRARERRQHQEHAQETVRSADWDRRRELTRYFIDVMRPRLQIVYRRLHSEGITPQDGWPRKGVLRQGTGSLFWLGAPTDAGLLATQYGSFLPYINFIDKGGDFFFSQKLEFRRPGVHRDGGMSDIGRIERPVFRPIRPPRNASKSLRSNAVSWSDRDDALELTAYWIASSIGPVSSAQRASSEELSSPIVVDQADGAIYFVWSGKGAIRSDDESLPPADQRGPEIRPPKLEPLDNYVARSAARVIALHRLSLPKR